MSTLDQGSTTLYARIGGHAALSAAVDLFYAKVLVDDLLKPFFDGIEMRRQKGKLRAFLAFALGGPVRYDGQDLRAAHAPLVERGLDEACFAAVAGHLRATLAELGVPAELTEEVLSIAQSTHDDVLGM